MQVKLKSILVFSAMVLVAVSGVILTGCQEGEEAAEPEGQRQTGSTTTTGEPGSPQETSRVDSPAEKPGKGSGTTMDLVLKWEPGKTYYFENSTQSRVKMPLPGQEPVDSVTTMVMEVRNGVSEHEKGIKVGFEFGRVMVKTNLQGLDIEYDSADPTKSEGLLAGMLAPVAKAKFAAIYSGDGDFIEMEGLDSVQAAGQLGVGKGELEAMTRQSAQFVPNKTVAIGESWESEVDLPMGSLGQDLVLLYSCILEEVVERDGKRLARILISGKTRDEALRGEDGEQVLTVKARKIAGEILFDPILGQPVEIRNSMEMEMAVPASIPKAEGAPGTMPMSTESVQKLVRVE